MTQEQLSATKKLKTSYHISGLAMLLAATYILIVTIRVIMGYQLDPVTWILLILNATLFYINHDRSLNLKRDIKILGEQK